MNICKIESIIPGKPWTSQHGTMHSFTIVFADGIRGEANAKTNPPPYKVGDKVGYEIAGTTPIGTNKLKIDRKADPALCRDTTPPEAPDFEAALPRPASAPTRTPQPAQAPRSVPQNAPAGPSVPHDETICWAIGQAITLAIAEQTLDDPYYLETKARALLKIHQSIKTNEAPEESSVPF